MALRAGLPETYDFGGERISWMEHAATNWMGDDAFLRTLSVRLLAFCFVGDTVYIGGKVVDKRIDNGDNVVDVEFTAQNQRDEIISTATATVILPTKRDPAASTVPSVIPDDLSIFQ
jgi:acyl dehydratase